MDSSSWAVLDRSQSLSYWPLRLITTGLRLWGWRLWLFTCDNEKRSSQCITDLNINAANWKLDFHTSRFKFCYTKLSDGLHFSRKRGKRLPNSWIMNLSPSPPAKLKEHHCKDTWDASQRSTHGVLALKRSLESPRGKGIKSSNCWATPRVSDAIHLEGAQNLHFNKFSGNSEAAGPVPHFENHGYRIIPKCPSIFSVISFPVFLWPLFNCEVYWQNNFLIDFISNLKDRQTKEQMK
jgi:hypothetical protein